MPGRSASSGLIAALSAADTPTTTRRQFLGAFTAALAVPTLLRKPLSGSSNVNSATTPVAGLPTALIADAVCKCHLTGPHARECPERFDAVLGALSSSKYFSALRRCKPRPATDEEILACHASTYLALAQREIASGAARLSTGDTHICRDSLTAAHYASGAACVGVDSVLTGQAKNAFCLTRPPGHHATPSRGMGFCIFNNVGIAARYAQRKHGVNKVLIIDWDVHHGNGTQDIFYEDPTVFFFSTHQSPWYPWTGTKEETGRGKGLGTTLNCPMARGAARKEFWSAFQSRLAPAVDRFKPELILISAGFDARHGDPLGRFELTDQDFADLTGLVLEMAHQHAGGRVVSVLEGGYNLAGLASAAAAHCGRLQVG
jgi:acetoin utilization deacetylase AcuC-like enzyme